MARWIRVHSRGELTGDDLTAVRSHGDAVERQSHAAQAREAAVHRRAYRSSRKAEGAATVSHLSDLQLTGGEDP